MRWKKILVLGVSVFPCSAWAEENWVEVGADPQGRYYVDASSIAVDGETMRFRKKGVYNFSMVDTFGGKKVSFRESMGIIELDCARRIHRVIQMDIVSPGGKVEWTTGKMNRMWENIAPNSLGEVTHAYVCRGMTSS